MSENIDGGSDEFPSTLSKKISLRIKSIMNKRILQINKNKSLTTEADHEKTVPLDEMRITMKKNLFICETPFQLLAAVLVINDSLVDDVNDFILVSTMTAYEKFAVTMTKHPLVNYVYAAEIDKTLNRRTCLAKLRDIFSPFSKRWKYGEINTVYDTIYCRNYTTIITESAFRFFKKKNPYLEVIILDEGYSSYLSRFWNAYYSMSFFHKLINLLLDGKKNFLYKNIREAKFFLPKLLHINLDFPIKKMLSDNFSLNSNQISEINAVFSYKDGDATIKHFIFFEECFYFDNNNNNDMYIINELSQMIGKEKILIKLHPRSQRDRFSSLGFNVMKNSDYPWEVFAINNSNSNIVLLAFSSGALMNYLFFTKSTMKSILLYKIFPNEYEHMIDAETLRWFDEFSEINKANIIVPRSITELKEIVLQHLSKV